MGKQSKRRQQKADEKSCLSNLRNSRCNDINKINDCSSFTEKCVVLKESRKAARYPTTLPSNEFHSLHAKDLDEIGSYQALVAAKAELQKAEAIYEDEKEALIRKHKDSISAIDKEIESCYSKLESCYSNLRKLSCNDINKINDYLSFTGKCINLKEFRKAARYPATVPSNEFHSLHAQDFQNDWLKTACIGRHAVICALVQDFDMANDYYKKVLEHFESPRKLIPSFAQGQILGDMADIIIKSSINKCKRVTRIARKETIASYENAVTLLKDYEIMGTEQESVAITIVTNCRKLGMEYGKMKLWRKAHEELEHAVEYLKSCEDKIHHSSMFCEQIALLKGALGSLWLEQYKESSFYSLREDKGRLKMLKKAQGYTLEALYKLIDAEQCIEDGKVSLHCIFNHDYARQCYFLGKVDAAFDHMSRSLESYIHRTDICHGCGQNHGEDKVEKLCSVCKIACYCNTNCQALDWRGERHQCNVPHKYLCPLLKVWNNANRNGWNADNDDVKEEFVKYFESFNRTH